MGDDVDVQPPGCSLDDEADPTTVAPGPDDRVQADSSDTGSLAAGSRARKQTEKKHRMDLPVMGTNDSSIVSKRSVESQYYPKPHLFRYFVHRPKRRTPIINRGYWLRMYTIETIVKRFLNETSEKRKIILNLGCGYDALPFQLLAKEPDLCRDATFVDVDFPALMQKKSQIITEQPALRDLLDKVLISLNTHDVSLRSEQYIAVGCDLRDIRQLDALLRQQFDLPSCTILVVAEVSITYMEPDAADELVRYTSGLGDVQFCLLEQYLPAGPNHPFAKQMLGHFNTLNTPLKSINRYPKLRDQEVRFTDAGWASATARSLWDLWSDPRFITARERISLNAIEVFDEWEEFALFASHYLLLVASNTVRGNAFRNFMEATSLGFADSLRFASADGPSVGASDLVRVSADSRTVALAADQERRIARRFGVLYQSGVDNFCYHGGYGERTRLGTADMYVSKGGMPVSDLPPPLTMHARMCHTITSFPETPGTDHVGHLIVGGRSSPDHALADCWFQRKHVWERVEDLPKPLYRHCATLVTDLQGHKAVLVYGGKSNDGSVMNEWLLWRDDGGWTKLKCAENRLTPRFGAAMSSDGADYGILLGGMAEDGTVLPEYWRWSLNFATETPSVNITAHLHKSSMLQRNVCRFGASLTQAPSCLYLVGGISQQGILPDDYNVVEIWSDNPFHLQPVPEPRNSQVPTPLLVGHSSIWDGKALVILGGGAVCFSFGNHSNFGVWKIVRGGPYIYNPWTLKEGDAPLDKEEPPQKRLKLTLNGKGDGIVESQGAPEPVSRERIHEAERFVRLVRKSRPVVLEGLKLGRCTTSWTTEYLKRKIGPDFQVRIHESEGTSMDSLEKNFRYATRPFERFIDDTVAGKFQYLRALSEVDPVNRPANFASDFASIAEDFQLPPELLLAMHNPHSSVLRISGPVSMWLHYDVMANVLCQIRGTKRLLLYPPSDILHLGIPHGGSSSRINVLNPNATDRERLSRTHPVEALLRPGEILFIPPLWAHSARPSDGISVSVNVFFRDLESGYAAGRDVYGNRDLQAYEDGRRDIDKIAKRFRHLPPTTSEFYLGRLAEELKGLSEQ